MYDLYSFRAKCSAMVDFPPRLAPPTFRYVISQGIHFFNVTCIEFVRLFNVLYCSFVIFFNNLQKKQEATSQKVSSC